MTNNNTDNVKGMTLRVTTEKEIQTYENGSNKVSIVAQLLQILSTVPQQNLHPAQSINQLIGDFYLLDNDR